MDQFSTPAPSALGLPWLVGVADRLPHTDRRLLPLGCDRRGDGSQAEFPVEDQGREGLLLASLLPVMHLGAVRTAQYVQVVPK